ncbi:MAG: hypothetical protein JKY55_03440, partial [Aliivibrio sp.]|nr:hypothetical protein [Aliivibrio sp.]
MENISKHRLSDDQNNVRRYHQAKWDEPIIFELSTPGERGILVPSVEKSIREDAGEASQLLPSSMRRAEPPKLPEMSQNRVLRHYLRLSQENLGADFQVDVAKVSSKLELLSNLVAKVDCLVIGGGM